MDHAVAGDLTFELQISGTEEGGIDAIKAHLMTLAIFDWAEVATVGHHCPQDLAPYVICIYRQEVESLQQIQADLGPGYHYELKSYPAILWQEACETDFETLKTRRFLVANHPNPLTDSDDRLVLNLTNTQVFGSGDHATTQAILRLLETQPLGEKASLLDVGTGTGILAIAGAKLGYHPIVATDICHEALTAADHNARANAVGNLTLINGSLPPTSEKFSLVISNILPPEIQSLLPDLVSHLAPNGTLMITGFNLANISAIHQTCADLALVVSRQVEVRGWLALALERTSQTP